MNSLPEYKEKKLQSITQANLDLDTEEEKKAKEEEIKKASEKLSPLLETMKKSLDTHVKDVVISDRLTTTPVCLVSSENDPSAHMQRLLAQMGQEYNQPVKRILEINPSHPVFEKMLQATAEQQTQWAEILYNQALLNEGSAIPDPVKFSQQVANLMVQAADNKAH